VSRLYIPWRARRAARRAGWAARRLGWGVALGTVAALAAIAGIEVAAERFDIDLPPEMSAPPETPLPTPAGRQPAGSTVEAVITSWRDADTLVTTAGPIRLENVEAPEVKPHDWKCDDPQLAAAALAHAQALAPVGSTITLRYEGRMSWDRHIAWVTLPDGRDLGEALLATATVATYPNPSGECPR